MSRENPSLDQQGAYWRANIWLMLGLLLVWFLVSFVAGILLFDYLNQFRLFGYKLGFWFCLLYTSPSPRDGATSRMPSSA